MIRSGEKKLCLKGDPKSVVRACEHVDISVTQTNTARDIITEYEYKRPESMISNLPNIITSIPQH